MIVIFSDKPLISKAIGKYTQEHYREAFQTNKKIVFIHVKYFLNMPYAYPRSIVWNKFPYLSHPEFKLKPWSEWSTFEIVDGKPVSTDITNDDINSCDEILFTGDMTQPYFFSRFLEKFNIPHEKVKAISLYQLDEHSISEAFKKKTDFYHAYSKQIDSGNVLAYFNYNFNFNSYAIIGKVLQKFEEQDKFISKYMLQLLYEFRDNNLELSESKLIEYMHHWNGTGKYTSNNNQSNNNQFNNNQDYKNSQQENPQLHENIRARKVRLGSSASFSTIVDNLLKMEFIEKIDIDGKKSPILVLSDKGFFFLSLLPKDCKDLDLPFRLELWAQDGLEHSKEKIDTYLYQFFSKIKRRIQAYEILSTNQ